MFSQANLRVIGKYSLLTSNCNMLQNLLYLAVIITVVYSDCCPKTKINKTPILCTNKNDIECHMKHYGIYCCNSNVNSAIKRFADIFVEIVSLSCT